MIYSYKTFDLAVKDVDQKKGIISGYFSAFNIKDSDGDIIRPGAFTKSISEWGPSAKGRIKHLLNHNPSMPLGKILDLKEDDKGLHYTSKIGTHTLGQDFLKMVESDLVKEHSIGFTVLQESKSKDEDANIMTELKLFEGSSLTAWGSNEHTPLTEVKGMTKENISDRIKAFEKFARHSTASDETIDSCLIYIKQLGQELENISSIQAVKAPEPQRMDKNLNTDIQLLILKHF